MELLSPGELLSEARGKYAVPAVNCFNLEMIFAVLDAAEELHSPIIVQASPRDIAYSSAITICEIVKSIGETKNCRMAIHLDHGHCFGIAVECVRAGFTGIMFDGSALSFDENIQMTQKVAELTHAGGLSCEAELGTIGDKNEYGENIANSYMTDPAKAKVFVNETNVDSLAVGIGNAHGFYPFPPNLDLERLSEIQKLVDIPLVLHGGSGLPPEQIKAAIKLGIAKINFSTAARNNMVEKMKSIIEAEDKLPKLSDLCSTGREGFKNAVREVIFLCGSDGKI